MFSLIKKISNNRTHKILVHAILILIANILEGFGATLIVPVIQKFLNQGPNSSLSSIIDSVYAYIGIEPTLYNTLLLFNLAFIGKTAISMIAKRFSAAISSDFLYEIQTEIYGTLLHSKIALFQKEKNGKFSNALTTELARAASVFVSVATWISNVTTAVVYILIAIQISFALTLISMLLGALFIFPIQKINKKANFFGKKWSAYNEEMQVRILETLNGIKFLKANALEANAFTKFKNIASNYKENWRRVAFNSNLAALLTQPIAVLILSVVLIFSLSLKISISELALFLFSFQRLIPTMGGIVAARNEVETNRSAFEKLEELLLFAKQNQEFTTGQPPPHFHESIRIKKLTYSHSPENPLINDLTVNINFGEVVGIIGPSGCGKTTLVDLLLCLYKYEGGDISVDGASLQSFSPQQWRKQIAYVAQDNFLFNDTIINNLRLGNPDLPMDKIVHYCKLANAYDFIMQSPKQFETEVGEKGSHLSGGQKQRLALARALIAEPRILVLDEVTSALDPDAETKITESLAALKALKQMTIILITHREKLLQVADNIIEFNKH